MVTLRFVVVLVDLLTFFARVVVGGPLVVRLLSTSKVVVSFGKPAINMRRSHLFKTRTANIKVTGISKARQFIPCRANVKSHINISPQMIPRK
jgi:hypothetical protein